MEITRDLVFGVMAVQTSLIDPIQLARAMATHFKDGRALPEVMLSEGLMSATQCDALNRDLDHELQNHRGDLQGVMNQLGSAALAGKTSDTNAAAGETRSEPHGTANSSASSRLEETLDSGVQSPSGTAGSQFSADDQTDTTFGIGATANDDLECTRSLQPSELDGPQSGSNPGDPLQVNTVEFKAEQCSRYTLTRVYGEGGLGQVWLAIDPNLKREVALKNIRPGKDGKFARQRLIREAQITGQLEHPNIIPIYELDQASPDSAPFYTMRLLRGETLQEKISKYQKHRKKGTVDPLELPELLNAFIDICHAMAYAASRGVMHRDLKPQNIMLGDFGEVLVLDWGLAKQVGEVELSSAEVQREAIKLTPSSVESQTVIGQVMGSPAYMAPEQATGRIDLMDARTDIYGLGAILFAILTGKGPHRGQRTGNTAKDTMALLKRISDGETPRVRTFDPHVPRPLDAICCKAMQRERDDRYQSATELARDVQRFLADEPVTVYVEPWQLRVWRWVRRHRVWTQSVAAALVVTTVVASAAWVLVSQARSREAEAHDKTVQALRDEQIALADARAAKQEAVLRFRQARRAVDESFTGISQALLNYPGVQKLRTQLLENAASEYERFAAERSDDPELQLELALALVRLGDVRRLLAMFTESEQAYGRAIAVFDGLLKQEHARAEVRLALAQCYNALGMLHVTVGSLRDAGESTGSFAAARQAYDKAATTLAAESEESEGAPNLRRTAARTVANLGVLLSRTSEFDAAIDALRRAAVAFEELADEMNDPDDRSELAKTRIAIGELLVQVGRSTDAEVELNRAIECYEALVEQNQGEPSYLQGLADARITLGNALQSSGRRADRVALYEASVIDYTALFRTRPDVPRYRERLASTKINLAQVLNALGRNEEAKAQANGVLQLSIDLVTEYTDVAENHALEAYSLVTLGQILRDLQDQVLAETAFHKAMEKVAMLIEALPDQTVYVRLSGEIKNNMGTVLLLRKDYTNARQLFTDARADFENALTRFPEDAFARDGLIWTLTYLGDTLRQLERQAEAKTFYQRALQMHKANGKDPQRQFQLAWFLVNCEDHDFRDPGEASLIAERISQQSPTDAQFLVLQAAAWYRQGAWQQCLAKLDAAGVVHLRGKSAIDFWRAMALQGKSPGSPEAKPIFDRACAQMEKYAPGDLKLVRLREEAAALLGFETSQDDT